MVVLVHICTLESLEQVIPTRAKAVEQGQKSLVAHGESREKNSNFESN